MRILTIGPSPHLLTSSGRINRDILESLFAPENELHSIVWNHDPIHFMPNEVGEHSFYNSKGIIAKLHPFLGEKGEFTPFLYEKMKVTQPDVVVTIGNYKESTEIWPIKAMYGGLFKWLAILTDCTVINENYRERLQYIDMAICTSKAGQKALNAITSVKNQYIPYGASEIFQPLNEELPKDFGIISLAKNMQISNPAAFIKAASKAKIPAYLHTNIDDNGDNNIRLLLKRYDIDKNVIIPVDNFVSIREGIKDSHLNVLYNRSHAIVDCSMQSSTALTMLEAMATGCVPVGMDFGAVGEVLETMPEPFRYIIPHSVFLGQHDEEYAIPNIDALSSTLNDLKTLVQNEKDCFEEAREQAKLRSSIFSKEKFVRNVKEILEQAVDWPEKMAVDSY